MLSKKSKSIITRPTNLECSCCVLCHFGESLVCYDDGKFWQSVVHLCDPWFSWAKTFWYFRRTKRTYSCRFCRRICDCFSWACGKCSCSLHFIKFWNVGVVQEVRSFRLDNSILHICHQTEQEFAIVDDICSVYGITPYEIQWRSKLQQNPSVNLVETTFFSSTAAPIPCK